MKNIYLIIFLFIGVAASAQSPDKMSYQAVIRDANGAILKNQNVTIQFTVIQPSTPGTPVYQEFHRPTTNTNGLVSIYIGTGTVSSGNFGTVDWSSGPYFLQTEIDPTGGFNYVISSTTELVSVPYTLHANVADSLIGGVNETDPVYDASIAKGITAIDTVYWNSKLDSSSIQNFVDLTTAQTVAGAKTFSSDLTVNGITVGKGGGAVAANIAIGDSALYSNTTGFQNAANGNYALFYNTTGYQNTANGMGALYSNTTGSNNTANSFVALQSNTTGSYNTANGVNALGVNTTGSNNTANGNNALYSNTTGYNNTALGNQANVSFGNLSNATALGNRATVSASNRVRIGNSSVSRIGGQVAWTNLSDGRIKENVQEAVPGLSFISELRPVTYKINTRKQDEITMQAMPDSIKERRMLSDADYLESSSIVRTGFIAQEVEAAAKKVGFDFDGVSTPENETDLYGIRYAEFVVPLVKAMQEQQEMIGGQQATIEQQKNDFQKQLQLLLERIEALEKE